VLYAGGARPEDADTASTVLAKFLGVLDGLDTRRRQRLLTVETHRLCLFENWTRIEDADSGSTGRIREISM